MAFTNTCGFFHCIFVMNVSPTQKKKRKKKKRNGQLSCNPKKKKKKKKALTRLPYYQLVGRLVGTTLMWQSRLSLAAPLLDGCLLELGCHGGLVVM